MPAEVTPPPRITQLLADFAAGLHYEELPEPVRRLMPMLLIDVFRAAAIGIRTPWAGTAAGIMRSLGGNPESSIFFRAERTDLVRAAYLNGVICGSLDWDDSHVAALIHPGVVIWPAALAIGEKLGVNGRELLTAVAIGYEVAIRIGMSIQPNHSKRGFQGTPTCGVFGAATACAKLLALEPAGIRNALGIAASFASGIAQFFLSGSDVKRLHAGKAAANGVEAALFAAAGLSGPADAIEGRQGFARAFSNTFDAAIPAARLGSHYWTTSISLKAHAGTARLQASIEAAAALARDGVMVEQVEKMAIGVNRAAVGKITVSRPVDHQQALISAPFAAAMALTLAPQRPQPLVLTLDDFRECLDDKRIQALAARTECVVDDEIERLTTHEYVPGRVIACLRDGRRLERLVVKPKGCPDNPFTEQEVCDRLRLAAAPHVTGAALERWLDMARNLAALKDMRPLMALTA